MNKNLKKYLLIYIVFILVLLIIYPRYYFLIWNIFLAFIPYILSLIYPKLKNIYLKIINIFLALLFYPNAIYVFTDLIHIQNMKFYIKTKYKVEYIYSNLEWIKITLIFIAVIISIKLSYLAIKSYINNFKIKENKLIVYLIYTLISFLTGLAVFVGRFVRLNSWDLIINPIKTVLIILSQINIDNIVIILIFTIIQLVVIYIEEENK